MKVAFVFTPSLLNGRTLDFTNLMGDTRVATGSEILMLAFPAELEKRGHEVTLFIERPNAAGYILSPGDAPVAIAELSYLGDASSFDAVIAIGVTYADLDLFRAFHPKCLRACIEIMNSMLYATPGFDEFIDLHLVPSERSRQHLACWPTDPKKWEVLPLGCYPNSYPAIERVFGRCVYISSPDRGLHLALERWPDIRAAVPHAELHVFYGSLSVYLQQDHSQHPQHGPRSASIRRNLTLPGVVVRGGVPRNEMARELSTAELLLFPASTVAYSEGFSCSTLEGCASGALPILCGVDALGDIYRGAVPMVNPPAEDHLEEWTSLVIRALTVPAWAGLWRAKAKRFAEKHAWPVLAEKLEKILTERLLRK